MSGDERALGPIEGPITVTDADTLVRLLETALEHADDEEEAEYWIRRALQHLVMERSDFD
jgi:hypothetical protein